MINILNPRRSRWECRLLSSVSETYWYELANRSLSDTSEDSSDSMFEEHARMSHDVQAD
jgi:hypothetical protein